MMEQIVFQQVINDPEIGRMLARYEERPAFFYQKSPHDGDQGWTKPCFPRCDYIVDNSYDAERGTSGTLTINILIAEESALGALEEDAEKELESRFIELISGTFYSDEQATTCAIWQSSTPYTTPGAQIPVAGIELVFGLITFTPQQTTDPDPVVGCNNWLKNFGDQIKIIGHDELPACWKPTDETPAAYWRLEGLDATQETHSVTWYAGSLALHVIAETVPERNRWTKAIAEELLLYGEVILQDTSPMFVKKLSVKHDGDPLRTGQISMVGHYGVLAKQRRERAQRRLLNPYFSQRQKEEIHHGKRNPNNTRDN